MRRVHVKNSRDMVIRTHRKLSSNIVLTVKMPCLYALQNQKEKVELRRQVKQLLSFPLLFPLDNVNKMEARIYGRQLEHA